MAWRPLGRIAFGFAVSPFDGAGDDGSDARRYEAHPAQIPLAVGDEVYAFEEYVPREQPHASTSSSHDFNVWYRGYVVSSVPSDTAPFDPFVQNPPREEPQVTVGIFPASHVRIREHLVDSAKRWSTLDDPPLSSRRHDENGRMEALPEEDEGEYDDSTVTIASASRANGGSPQPPNSARKSRLSTSSMASEFANAIADPRRLSQRSQLNGIDLRPPPPLPNLKCGDETLSGANEPLVDEVACALRDWTALLYTHLSNRDYALFSSVRSYIGRLHHGRGQLLALSLQPEKMDALRRELVELLVLGNREQGLDMIVRHPTFGSLADVEANARSGTDLRGCMSAVRMYATHVKTAYPGSSTSGLLASRLEIPHARDPTIIITSPSNPGIARPSDPPAPEPSSFAGGRFHHVALDLRKFLALPCGPDETVELYFSLYSKTDARFVTEEFLIVLDELGEPLRAGRVHTLFRDLGQHDVQDALFLVCRIFKNGRLKDGGASSVTNGRPSYLAPSRDVAPIGSFESVSATGVDYSMGTSSGMLGNGRQSCRRPFGCAVIEISQLLAYSTAGDNFMPIFVPVHEGTFSTLHRDIIASRVKAFEKSPRAEGLSVGLQFLWGDAATLVQEMPLLAHAPITSRLGFPDVVFPGVERNDVYVRLQRGDFVTAKGETRGLFGSGVHIEVEVEVRTREGALLDRVISRGTGEPNVTRFSSMVFRSTSSPTYGELIKLELPVEMMEQCHLFLTFRSRGREGKEPPFAFGWLPLFLDDAAFVPDGPHTLMLYRYSTPDTTQATAPSTYLQASATVSSGRTATVPASLTRILLPLRDTMVVQTLLVSTRFSQDGTLLAFLRWESLLSDPKRLKEVLTGLKFISAVEVGKFLPAVLDGHFGILVSVQNADGELDDLVLSSLVAVLGIVSDHRFSSAAVLNVYLSRTFNCSTASTRLIKALHRLLRDSSGAESGPVLRSAIKAWRVLFAFIVRSREIQRLKASTSSATALSSHLETAFKRELSALLTQINALMRTTSPSSIIGTQTLAVQHFASILTELGAIYDETELLGIATSFVNSISAWKGKIVLWKLVLLNQVVSGTLFDTPSGRCALVPNLIRWLKPSLGKFDELRMCSLRDTPAVRDGARVGWIEGVRLGLGVLAATLDRLHEALITPAVQQNRSLLAQEQDNVEYLLGLLPQLLDSYRELQSGTSLASVVRQKSIIPAFLLVFPSSYPFSLLSLKEPDGPTLRSGLGEIACVLLAFVSLAPRPLLVNFLQATLQIEGPAKLAALLSWTFRVSTSILKGDAFPTSWLNMNVFAHQSILKLLDPVAELLVREFIPPESSTFEHALWTDFFGTLVQLLGSRHLLIEQFSPQQRRAVWRLAGDLRGDGARVLLATWRAIGWPGHEGRAERVGRYQVRFSGLVGEIIALACSHHDELRSTAVALLHAMITNEYSLNHNFAAIESEVIDRLDKQFAAESPGIEAASTTFVEELAALFDDAADEELRSQVNAFVALVSDFLGLLTGVQSLPEGSEWQEDRVILTLKLMSFVRGIGRSDVFVRYVNRIVDYHVASEHFTEAGMTLKLHADLYDWSRTTFASAIGNSLPRATNAVRKETLYLQCLEYLARGQAWETALALCSELQAQFTLSFDYLRLSELLQRQSALYASIATVERDFGELYRVAFFGNAFPKSVSGKQFIYRHPSDPSSSATFVDKMLSRHPFASLLKSSVIPRDEIVSGEGAYLQITRVEADPDRGTKVLGDDVDRRVRSWWMSFGTNTFAYEREVRKDVGRGVNDRHRHFLESWKEKTILITEETFPTVLLRTEVSEIRIIDISPLESSLASVLAQTAQLQSLERHFSMLSQTVSDRAQNALLTALNASLDTGEDEGVPFWRSVFLERGSTIASPPAVQSLAAAIDDYVMVLMRLIQLHALLCAPEMRNFHEELEALLEKNYHAEIARLPAVGEIETPFFSTRALSVPLAIGSGPLLSNGSINSVSSRAALNLNLSVVGSPPASPAQIAPVQSSNGHSRTSSAASHPAISNPPPSPGAASVYSSSSRNDTVRGPGLDRSASSVASMRSDQTGKSTSSVFGRWRRRLNGSIAE